MSFDYPTPPDPAVEYWEAKHYQRAIDNFDKEGGLVNCPTLEAWFLSNVCELAFGEDSKMRYSPREIFEKLEEFSKDAQAYTDLLEEHEVRQELDDMEYQRQCSH